MKPENKEFWQICRNIAITDMLTFPFVGLFFHWSVLEIVLCYVLGTVISSVLMYFFFYRKKKGSQDKRLIENDEHQ